MSYIVIEIQKNLDGTIGNFVWSYDNINEAESKFHSILSFAAVSTVYVHSAAILNESGFLVKTGTYKHEPEQASDE